MKLGPLRTAIAAWRPPLQLGRPFESICAAWPTIVGPEVARSAFPTALEQSVLLVTTRSGTWSQQLALLEARILEGLQALPEAASLKALRFRVGKLRVPKPVSPSKRPAAAPKPFEREAAASVSLTELADRIGRRVREHERWAAKHARCTGCGLVLRQGTCCAPCLYHGKLESLNTVLRLLTDAPWLVFEDVLMSLPGTTRREYDQARLSLLNRWQSVLDRARRLKHIGPAERIAALGYVQLESCLPPTRITPAVCKYFLGAELEKLLDL